MNARYTILIRHWFIEVGWVVGWVYH